MRCLKYNVSKSWWKSKHNECIAHIARLRLKKDIEK